MTKLPFEDEIMVGDVRRDWDAIYPYLMDIKIASNAKWRCEDLYAMCVNGQAYLYLFDGGFCIAGRIQDQFTRDVELHLYALASSRKDSVKKLLPFVEGLGRQVGAVALSMESVHNQSTMMRYGWEPEYTRYRRSLT